MVSQTAALLVFLNMTASLIGGAGDKYLQPMSNQTASSQTVVNGKENNESANVLNGAKDSEIGFNTFIDVQHP